MPELSKRTLAITTKLAESLVLHHASSDPASQAYSESELLRRTSLPTPSQLQLYRRLRFGDLLALNTQLIPRQDS